MTPERFLELETQRTRARLAAGIRETGLSVERDLGIGDWIRRHPALVIGGGLIGGLVFGRIAGPSGLMGLTFAISRFTLRRLFAVLRAVALGGAGDLGEAPVDA